MGAWVVVELGGSERSYSLSCLPSLPPVWDVWTDMYICGAFSVMTDVQGWTPLGPQRKARIGEAFEAAWNLQRPLRKRISM